jgi:hypothetical protein
VINLDAGMQGSKAALFSPLRPPVNLPAALSMYPSPTSPSPALLLVEVEAFCFLSDLPRFHYCYNLSLSLITLLKSF